MLSWICHPTQYRKQGESNPSQGWCSFFLNWISLDSKSFQKSLLGRLGLPAVQKNLRPDRLRACCFANPSPQNPFGVGISQPLARRLFSANCRGFILIAPGYPKCQRHLNTTLLPCPSLFLQGRCSAT